MMKVLSVAMAMVCNDSVMVRIHRVSCYML
jgi:hypothetical protein